jgi:hypothetical protein
MSHSRHLPSATGDTPTLYSPNQALCASFLGNLPAGVYVLQHNLKALGRPDEARKTAVLGVALLLPFLLALCLLPGLYADGLAIVMVLLVRQRVAAQQAAGNAATQPASNLATAAVALAGMVMTAGLALSLVAGAAYLGRWLDVLRHASAG